MKEPPLEFECEYFTLKEALKLSVLILERLSRVSATAGDENDEEMAAFLQETADDVLHVLAMCDGDT